MLQVENLKNCELELNVCIIARFVKIFIMSNNDFLYIMCVCVIKMIFTAMLNVLLCFIIVASAKHIKKYSVCTASFVNLKCVEKVTLINSENKSYIGSP